MSTNSDNQFPLSGRRPRGRPRDLEKREAILDAASALFSERGLAGATIEAVAERAEVSKMTVYANFPDKPALLSAVFARTVATVTPPDFAQGPDPARLVEQLIEFGERFVEFLMRREILGPGRVFSASAGEVPGLARAFYASGPGAFRDRIAAFLEACVARDLLAIADTATAAEILMAAWLGLDQLRANLGVEPRPTAKTAAGRIREATETLTRGWGFHPRRLEGR
jgi:TetR/AcrR family transcriptional repressor of mexJK operon